MVKLLKLLDQKILFWGLAFLLFFIPLYPKFPLLGVSGTYVAIRLEDIFVAVLVFLFGLRLLAKKDFSLFKWPITGLFIVYFGVGLLSAVSGVWITKNITPHLAFIHLLRRMEYMSLMFVAYYALGKTKQLKVLGWITLVAVFGVIFYALGQKFFAWPVVSTMNKEFSKGMILRLTWWARVNSTFAGHYDLAAYMVMILPLTVIATIISKSFWQKSVIALLGIFSYYILILTASRVSFGAYLVSVGLVLFLAKKYWFLLPFFLFSILGMVFSDDLGQRYAATFKIDLSFLSGMVKVKPSEMPVAISSPTPTPAPASSIVSIRPSRPGRQRLATPTPTPTPEEATPAAYFEPTALAVGRSTDIRLKVEWPRAINAFLKNPILGTGYSSITLATDNDYLRMLGETGVLGALAFGAIILEIASRFWRFFGNSLLQKESRLFVLGAMGMAIGYFLNATFIDVFEASKVAFFFWIMIGLALKVVDLSAVGDEKK